VRRIFGYMAFTVGMLLLFLAPFLYLYSKPRVEKAPIDVYDTTVSLGTGNIFRARTTHLEGPLSLVNVSIAKSNLAASTKEIAVISIFNNAFDRATCDNPEEPDPLKLTGCEAVNSDFTIYAMDRVTGEEAQCDCGETPGIQGQTLKFPFGTKKERTYQFFDVTTHKAFPAVYVRTEKVAGLTTYLFQSDVSPTQIGTLDVPGALIGSTEKTVSAARWANATTSLWVEPDTGAIIKASQISSQWLMEGDRFALTLANTNFTNSDASIESTASKVRTKFIQLRFVELWLPFFGPLIGIVLIVVGLVLLRSTWQSQETAVREPARVAT
jgi:Porin PorA